MCKRYLKKNKYTESLIPVEDHTKMFQMFVLGSSFVELAQEFPQYTLEQVLLTAAKWGWIKKRDSSIATLQEQIKVKILKSMIGSIDFVTMLLNCTNAKHVEEMRKHLSDPKKHKMPEMKIETLKEYKEMLETLQKLATSMTVTPADFAPKQTQEQLESKDSDMPTLMDLTTQQDEEKKQARLRALHGRAKRFQPAEKPPEESMPAEFVTQEVSEDGQGKPVDITQ